MRVLSLMLGLVVVVLALMAGIIGIDAPTVETFSALCDHSPDLDTIVLESGMESDGQFITARLIEVIEPVGTQSDNEYLVRDLLSRKCSVLSDGTRDGASPGCGLGTGGTWRGGVRARSHQLSNLSTMT